MSDQKQIKFYFDYISHNAYIAWTQIEKLAKKYQRDIEPIPVLFAGLLNAHNQRGPAEVPAKLNWMLDNTLRKAAVLNIPLNPPASHPYNPLLSLRASLIELKHQKYLQLIGRFFRAVWVDGLDVSNTDVVVRLFEECNINGSRAIKECHSNEIKEKLKINTEKAIERGIFGVPSMTVDNELFWGYDDFSYLELYLKGNDPLDKIQKKNWSKIKSTAQRNKDISNAVESNLTPTREKSSQ